jgi:hypothetical protein
MNEKKIPCFIFAVILFALCITGCRSITAVPDGTLIEHNLRVAELERTINDLTARIGQYDILIGDTITRLADARRRAGEFDATIDRLTYLIGEYERIVHELLDAYESLQNAIK